MPSSWPLLGGPPSLATLQTTPLVRGRRCFRESGKEGGDRSREVPMQGAGRSNGGSTLRV
eukprot:10380265-Alexandrium_andersonii.AAC.1